MTVRMMTLWRRGKAFGFPTEEIDDSDMREIARELDAAVPVNAQNVFEVFRDSGLPDSILDVPILSPWPTSFIEYSLDADAHVGVLIKMIPLDERSPAFHDGARYFHASWIFTQAGNEDVYICSRALFSSDAMGRLLQADNLSWSWPYQATVDLIGEDAALQITREIMSVVVHTLMFANCKNVQAVEEENLYPTRQARRAAERRGDPKPPRFYTLRINPNAMRKQGEGTSTSGRELSLHIVRGHFATYTDEKKLFGRHTGTFWIPAYVRGSQDVGIVGKDYEVAALTA